jgi:UDP-N-acetylmuramate: L-alanyl-gamma-D-glutamyl-meso-diaminopimelate ligase
MSAYLANIGIKVFSGYRAEHVSPRPDLVIIGNAVSRNNPEAEAVLNQQIPYLSFPQALGVFLIGARESLVITGTHGKTTTAALAAWVLTHAGLSPGFFVGGVPMNFDSGWSSGRGNYVVIEGDEYDSAFFDKGPKFLHYRPRHVILTSVEFDHADIYRDLEHLKDSFRRLIALIPGDGCLVVCGDYPAAMDVARSARGFCIEYGDGEGAEWTACNVQMHGRRTSFEPCFKGRSEGVVEVALIGEHNVKNALAVYIMGRLMGIETSKLRDGFATFAGVKRRQEVIGERRGVLVIDDFAHHPTAVRATLKAVRQAYPGRRVWAVFEPRSQTSRRKIFAQEFAQSLAFADRVVVAGLYQPEKIPEEDRLDVQGVVQTINRSRGIPCAAFIEGASDIAAHVAQQTEGNDIVLIMSNGGFDGVQEKILGALAG